MQVFFNSVINKIFKFFNLYLIKRKPFTETLVYTGKNTLPSISVAILIIEKDLDILQFNVNNLRKYCQNPISNIFIISPENSRIQEQCKLLDTIWINEETVAPISKKKIHEFLGESFRVNWFYQQFIKLNLDTIITDKNYLVIDADTILLNSQYFMSHEHMLLKVSDEYHYSYQATNQSLINSLKFNYHSFIAHHQLINKDILFELKRKIKGNDDSSFWSHILQAIKDNGNWFSEYELYGSFACQFYGDKVKTVYWHNRNLYFTHFSNSNLKDLAKKYVSASFHNYNYESYTKKN